VDYYFSTKVHTGLMLPIGLGYNFYFPRIIALYSWHQRTEGTFFLDTFTIIEYSGDQEGTLDRYVRNWDLAWQSSRPIIYPCFKKWDLLMEHLVENHI
jgi:hypothetical protein